MKRIAQITDTHFDEQFPIENGVKTRENWKRILSDVVERGIDHVIFTGDIGTTESNRWFFESVQQYSFDFNAILGNHDSFEEAIKFYNPHSSEEQQALFYANEDKYFNYIFLDTSTGEISEDQLQWFEDRLKREKDVVLFSHHPILETNTTPQREYPLLGSETINHALQQLDNDIYIFCGHLHCDDEKCEGNVRQFVTPAASFQTKKYSATSEKENINFGYRVIELDQDQVSSEVIMFNPRTMSRC